jgi:hypothetical protein
MSIACSRKSYLDYDVVEYRSSFMSKMGSTDLNITEMM